ncbi:MAG: ubiquinone/menaquinone biosynthesis C-methylase UbiE [Desulforhopalus sp.]
MCCNSLCCCPRKDNFIAQPMVKIYADYGDEPEDTFIPIPDHLACTYYNLEMDRYDEDALFYDTIIPQKSRVLELGCGSGRVGRKLFNEHRNITGVDISLSMLEKAKENALPKMHFLAMDMTNLAFSQIFDSIIIPYNSLNLLITKERILDCLLGCKKYLQPQGSLIAQIFIPPQKFLAEKKKSFQFQIFDRKPTGRIIKEIIKQYRPASETISVEERFRVRPAGPMADFVDYNNNYTVAAYQIADWLQLFETSGFKIKSCYEDFKKTHTYTTDSSCLVIICE